MIRSLLFLFVLSLLFPLRGTGQTEGEDDAPSGIAFNAIVPSLGSDFNARDRKALQTRLDQITSNYGTGGPNFNPSFVMVPNVIIEGFERTGQKTLAKLDIVLQTGNADTETKFTSMSMKSNGVGENKREALNSAINKIDTRSDELETFMKKSEKEVIAYYKEHCEDILQQAVSQAEMENFEQAFSFLFSIPSTAGCYDQAQDKVSELFSMYQEAKCAKLMSRARASHGAGKMDRAARYLALVPTNSECQEQAKELAEKMEEERLMKYETEKEIEKLKAKAARDIAIAFAKNQPDKQVDIHFLRTH